MKITIYIIATLALLRVGTGYAAGACSASKLASTQKKVAALMKADSPKESNSWEKLRKFFNGNRDCMAVYESYDFGEAIRHLIKNHWRTIGSLEKYRKEDDSFFSFVISGLKDKTANIEDIKATHALAEKSCPPGAEALCKEILEDTETAR